MLYPSLEGAFLIRKGCENVHKKISSFPSSAHHVRHGYTHARAKVGSIKF